MSIRRLIAKAGWPSKDRTAGTGLGKDPLFSNTIVLIQPSEDSVTIDNLTQQTGTSARTVTVSPTSTGAATPTWPYLLPVTTVHKYVSTTGNDANDGSQGTPWRTLSKAVQSATAGTTVHFAPGSYGGSVKQTINGTSGSQIVFVSDVLHGAKIVQPSGGTSDFCWDCDGDWVTIAGFEVDGTVVTGTRWRHGIYITGNNSSVTDCKVHDILNDTIGTSDGGSGIMTDAFRGGGNNSKVLRNIVYNIASPTQSSPWVHPIYFATTGLIQNNLVYRFAGAGLHLWHNATDVNISNNTVFNGLNVAIWVGAGGYYNGWTGPVNNCVVQNNIMRDCPNGVSEGGDLGNNNIYRNNHFFNVTNQYNLVTGINQGGTLTTNPLFVNYISTGGGDYRLQATSPDVNSGNASNAPTTDLLGFTRTSTIDRGAYEYGAAATVLTGPPTRVSSISRFGTYGLLFEKAKQNYLTITPFADFATGTSEIGCQLYWYATSVGTEQYLWGSYDETVPGSYGLRINTDATVSFLIQGGGTITTVSKVIVNQMCHLEVDRVGNSFMLFFNGNPEGSTLTYSGSLAAGRFLIGAKDTSNGFADGIMDSYQFVKRFLHSTAFGVTAPPPGGGGGGGASNKGWNTRESQIIDGANNAVQFTGVNFGGMVNLPGMPHGVGQVKFQDQLSHIKQLGFNCIRLVFSDPTVLSTRTMSAGEAGLNTDCIGLTPVQVMDKVVDYCDSINLFIVLDRHRSNWDGQTNGEWGMQRNGLWYETRSAFGVTTPQQTINVWTNLANRYKGKMCIWGADIHNECAGPATWGGGGSTDWPAFVEQCGNAIHAVNPDWLIVCEGVETGAQPWGTYVGPGCALQGVATRPVQLNLSNKVVYSSHPYGPALFDVGRSTPFEPFNPSNGFPDTSLRRWWDANWGYLFYNGLAPILLGEFGAPLDDFSAWYHDRSNTYEDRLLKYMAGQRDYNGISNLRPGWTGCSWTRWTWDGYSGDTAGILVNGSFSQVATVRYNPLIPYLFKGNVVKPISGAV